mmetsp:Transcript_102421/g.181891  ORF Transcript_102421/g.181891 Transcript_102421/m.181891 type:complete len:516 (+) Transcript_102421:42-1589(+)|eukprot:CAMPEP_0197625100 /NCGR_PEP_ID=MMETSP1338-20131121/4551_1 /TAXON_ID=43686 ORGANISM="Pelagodinium beii, Strain RCC1491" /NCGR_SAMPLE_ID=MMETSP1338 /ASSEMBLY_ACC=CAM_ASM_000754 /LENGTH=515 /DNA_ID=CAMNT_0043195415 /DNA_START=42 /DNA_END=1589 /DNA_ORIENTATION=+
MAATGRASRGQNLKSGNGVQAWNAYQERQNQDLLYRTEYLAGLVSSAVEVESPNGEDLQKTLLASPVPRLVRLTNEILSDRHPKASAGNKVPRTNPEWPDLVLKPQQRQSRNAWPQKVKTQQAYLKESLNPKPEKVEEPSAGPPYVEARDSHSRPATAVQGLAAWEETCGGVAGMLAGLPRNWAKPEPPPKEQNNFEKVQPVPRLHELIIDNDHQSQKETAQLRQLSGCVKVLQIVEDSEGIGDSQNAEMNFARFFCSLMLRPQESQVFFQSFERLDGDDKGSTKKFAFVDSGKKVVVEPQDGFRMPALVTSADPVPVFPSGHYFELEVVSVFRTTGRLERPKPEDPRGRSAGLVLGFKTERPGQEDRMAKNVASVSNSWCISTNGFFSCQKGPTPKSPSRSANQVRSTLETHRSWHQRKPLPSEQLLCTWPPPARSKGDGPTTRKFDFSLSLNEGDRIGLQALPFGALVLTVNGCREVMIADAGLPASQPLFPIIEVTNHIKALKLLPLVPPPS